jgi:hypothetical protein
MSRSAARRRGLPWALGIVVVAAVAIGAVAVLLSGTAPQVPPAPTTAGSAPLLLSYYWLGVAVLAIFAVSVGYMVYLRVTAPSMELPRFALASILTILLAIVLLLLVFRALGHGGPGGAVPLVAGNNSTGASGGGYHSNNSARVNATGNATETGAFPTLPRWASYALLGGVVLVVTLVVLPLLLAGRESPTMPGREESASAPVLEALSSTLDELERDPDADPRALIVALYARLLGAVGRGVGPTDTLTAREVERVCVEVLGVRAPTARELTVLFEEARYSTRPMGRASAERARQALADALADLRRPRRLA